MSSFEVPSHLASTAAMLRETFPAGLSKEDYQPLIVVLSEEMSQRNLAEVLSAVFGLNYHRILNDNGRAVDAADVERVRRKLVPFGYDQWLKEE